MVRALKTVFTGKRLKDEEDLKKHRRTVERLSTVAVPVKKVNIETFYTGTIECESVTPKQGYDESHVIFYIHGGGFICGGIAYARILAAKLAIATGYRTVSFAYRLAPEHPYPAAMEDALAVWEQLMTDGCSPERMLIAGDSAGGNMALCIVRHFIATGQGVPRELLLFSPWTDMTATAGSYEEYGDSDPMLTKEYVQYAVRAYIPEGEDVRDERFSPLNGSFEGFPPVYIMAGRNGILLDDSVRLQERINGCGGRAVLDLEEKGWHVYQQMPFPIANRAMERLAGYVKDEINGK